MPIKIKRNRKKSWPRGVLAYEAKTGTVLLEVTVPGTEGSKRRRKVTTISNFMNAEAEMLKFRHEVAQEFPTAKWEFFVAPADVALTFREFVESNRSLLLGGLSLHRKTVEQNILDAHLLPFFGDMLLRDVGDRELDGFLLSMKDKRYARKGTDYPYSPAYLNMALRILRKVLRRAVQYKALVSFPFLATGKAATEQLLHNELSESEYRALLAAFDDREGFRKALEADGINPSTIWGGFNAYFVRFQSFKPLFLAAIQTGLRRGDLLDLRWSDVHEDAIVRVMQKEKGRKALIPLSDSLKAALSALPKRGAYVFHVDGKKLSWSTVRRYFVLAKTVAGIARRVRFHDLRHSCGSMLASAGVSPIIIRDILGHANVRTTERYAKASEAAVKAVRVFD